MCHEPRLSSVFVGADETGVKVNGQKDWIWTWQNDDLTFITHSDNRGYNTIEDNFGDGLPNTVLVHDRYAAHFNCEAMHHQICMAHILRDLQYLVELYPKSGWATESKILIAQALELKKQLTVEQYYGHSQERNQIEEKLIKLLETSLVAEFKKAYENIKSMSFTFYTILKFLLITMVLKEQ